MESVSLDEAFFPVSRISLRRTDTGEGLKRHWAIVPDNGKDIFAVVTQSYQLVSNEKVCELGRKAFTLIFGKVAIAELRPFNLIMPRTRSWALIDFTADSLAFEPLEGDRWVPFLRVANSYNRTKAIQFTVGVCRWVCKNGIIFGEQSLTLRNTHKQGADFHSMLAGVFARRGAQFDILAVKSRIASLTKIHVPADQFLAGVLEILRLRVPDEIPAMPLQAAGWPELGPHLSELGQHYAEELGNNAYALLNAASDYASDVKAPRMNAPMANTLQSRCGRWTEDVVRRDREPAFDPIEFKSDSSAAAMRLMKFATQSGRR